MAVDNENWSVEQGGCAGKEKLLLRWTVETFHAIFPNRLRDVTGEISFALHQFTTIVIMGWSAPDGILSQLLSGDPLAILIAFVVSFSLPLLLHFFLYRATTRAAATPTFLLLGTTGAGKTSLLTLVSSNRSYAFGLVF